APTTGRARASPSRASWSATDTPTSTSAACGRSRAPLTPEADGAPGVALLCYTVPCARAALAASKALCPRPPGATPGSDMDQAQAAIRDMVAACECGDDEAALAHLRVWAGLLGIAPGVPILCPTVAHVGGAGPVITVAECRECCLHAVQVLLERTRASLRVD